MYVWTNLIFWEILVPDIWTKMLLGNQIAGFLNQLYLLKKMMKEPDFFNVNTNSFKLKVDLKELRVVWSKMDMLTLVVGF